MIEKKATGRWLIAGDGDLLRALRPDIDDLAIRREALARCL
jgi:hypothetical protein